MRVPWRGVRHQAIDRKEGEAFDKQAERAEKSADDQLAVGQVDRICHHGFGQSRHRCVFPVAEQEIAYAGDD